jgi:hypothetical protein
MRCLSFDNTISLLVSTIQTIYAPNLFPIRHPTYNRTLNPSDSVFRYAFHAGTSPINNPATSTAPK